MSSVVARVASTSLMMLDIHSASAVICSSRTRVVSDTSSSADAAAASIMIAASGCRRS
jgi:hypothetical protein